MRQFIYIFWLITFFHIPLDDGQYNFPAAASELSKRYNQQWDGRITAAILWDGGLQHGHSKTCVWWRGRTAIMDKSYGILSQCEQGGASPQGVPLLDIQMFCSCMNVNITNRKELFSRPVHHSKNSIVLYYSNTQIHHVFLAWQVLPIL